MNEKTARRIRALRAQGKSRREIATAVGLSTYPVRQALGLGGAGRASAPEPDGEEADEEADEAREAGGCDAEEGEPGDAGKAAGAEVDPERAAATSLLPVPLPAPRAAERSLARFGLLGEAAPLFTEGAGLSRLGAAHPADHPNGFVVLVGGSAKARKGPSWDHVARLVDRASPGFSLRCATGLSSGEGLVWARRDPDGATPGSLEPPLFVVEPELASILKAAGRDRSSLSPVRARRGTDGRPLALLTPNAPARPPVPHVALVGHITATELRHRVSGLEVANGLLVRSCIVACRRSRLLPGGGYPDPLRGTYMAGRPGEHPAVAGRAMSS